MTSLEGQIIGRYHLLEKIGEGGMATVYKARDTRLERYVAVKIIRVENFSPNILERVMQRFEREAKSLAQLSHPYIVKVIDYGEHAGAPYLVIEYLPGGTLKQCMGQPIPYPQAARLLLPIARALSYTHKEGLVHRDIKPTNILLNQSGEPLLTDFGIAKILEGAEGPSLTGSGVAIGTPDYMAPEQWLGEVGPQADIYALGAVFYEMLTGRKPFVADTVGALILKQTSSPTPKARQYVPDLPPQVDQVIEKAMHKDLAVRYSTMIEFADALEIFASPQANGSLDISLAPSPAAGLGQEGQVDRELSALQSQVEQAINLEAWEQASVLVDRMGSSGRISTREMQILKTKIFKSKQEVERIASRISRLEKVILEALSVEDFDDAEEHLTSLEKLGPRGQQMAERMRVDLGRQRQLSRKRDEKIASLASRFAQAIDAGEFALAEKALSEMETLGPKAQIEANRLKSTLEIQKEHARQRMAHVNQLSKSIQEAIDHGAWEDARQMLEEISRSGKEGQLEFTILKGNYERKRQSHFEQLSSWIERDLEAEAFDDVEQWLGEMRQLGKTGQIESGKYQTELEEARRLAASRSGEIERLKTVVAADLGAERWERAALSIDLLAGLGLRGKSEASLLQGKLEQMRREASLRHTAKQPAGRELPAEPEIPKKTGEQTIATHVLDETSTAIMPQLQPQAAKPLLRRRWPWIALAAGVFLILALASWVAIRDPWNFWGTYTPMPEVISQVSPTAQSTEPLSTAPVVIAATTKAPVTRSPTPEPSRTSSPSPSFTRTFTPTPSPTVSYMMVINTDSARLRAGPGTVYGVVTYMDKGSPLDAVGRNTQGDWLFVRFGDAGKTAWVSTKVVTFDFDPNQLPEVEAPPTPIPPPATSTGQAPSEGGKPTVAVASPTWTPPPP